MATRAASRRRKLSTRRFAAALRSLFSRARSVPLSASRLEMRRHLIDVLALLDRSMRTNERRRSRHCPAVAVLSSFCCARVHRVSTLAAVASKSPPSARPLSLRPRHACACAPSRPLRRR